jgi:hypothetical protein
MIGDISQFLDVIKVGGSEALMKPVVLAEYIKRK